MSDFINDIENCLPVLRTGGTILFPTDTVWAIGCDATDPVAVEKLITIKHQPEQVGFVVLVAEEQDVLRYTAAPDLAVFDFLTQQTQPTTVVFDHAIGLAENAIARDGSVAIRIVQDPFCRHLIKRFRKPLVAASANFADENLPASFPQINREIAGSVDYVVEHRRGESAPARLSRIIRWQGNGKFTVIRA